MTEKIQSQLSRMLNKVSQKFPQVEEPTVMTDIHIRINQETGDVMVFNDDEQEITRIVVDEWIDNQDDEDRNNQDRDACLRGRRNQLVDFTLGLEGNEGEVVVGIVVDIQQVGFAVVQLEELRLVKRVVTRVDVLQSEFGNLVDVGHPFLQIRVVENFSVSVDSD